VWQLVAGMLGDFATPMQLLREGKTGNIGATERHETTAEIKECFFGS